MKIFLDDTKLCPIGWQLVKTYNEFISIVLDNKDSIEEISLDYELKMTDKEHTGLDACNFLIENPVNCKQIIIHSTHPKAEQMIDILKGKYNVILEEYDMFKIMEQYKNQ